MNKEEPPVSLYKILSPIESDLGFRWLETPEVFLKRADLFEDQNDCSVPIEFATSTRAKRRARLQGISSREGQGLSNNRLKGLFRQRESEIPKDRPGQIAFDKRRATKFARKFAVLSLTEILDNELMWERYAKSHSGFCIGFDGRALSEYLSRLPSLQIFPAPVIYENEIKPFDISYGGSDDTYDLIMRIKDKATWGFEHEWRMIYYGFNIKNIPPTDAVKFIKSGAIISIPKTLIAGVFIGKKPAPGLKERLNKLIDEKSYPFSLVQTAY